MALEPYDVTGWILRLVAILVPQRYLLHGVFLAGSVISSLTAVLVFFFLKDVKNERAAFIASLLYGFLAQPLSMGVLLFTHDLIQMPLLLPFCGPAGLP